MLSSLRFAARRGDGLRQLLLPRVQQQPYGNSKPYTNHSSKRVKPFNNSRERVKRNEGTNNKRSNATKDDRAATRRPFEKSSNCYQPKESRASVVADTGAPKQNRHQKMKSYLLELQNFKKGSPGISAATLHAKLKHNLRSFRDEPETSYTLIQKSLEFEKMYPSFSGLVDGDCFFFAIQNCVLRDEIETADELLTLCRSIPHIEPHRNCFGIVMKGYAKRKTREGLRRIEEIVTSLEEERPRLAAFETSPLDFQKYTILMNTYIQVLRKEAVDPVRQTIDRMKSIAERLHDDSLRPDLICYTVLMKSYLVRRKRGFAWDMNAVLDEVKASVDYETNPIVERTFLENMVIDAWSKSSDRQALKRARQIFDEMDSPDTIAFNSLCQLYTDAGDCRAVLRLYETMKTDYESGINKDCRPDVRTMNIVLHALQKSKRPDAAEKVTQVFRSMPSPNAVLYYTTLMTIYGQQGDVTKALELVSQMQSVFDSGEDEACCPNTGTYNTFLNALEKSNSSDAVEKAEEMFEAIPLPDTISYNFLLNIVAQQKGNIFEKSHQILQRMQSDFDSGKSKVCRPNTLTYNAVLNAIYKSSVSDAAEKADKIFDSIPSPNTVSYNTLLNIYVQLGMGREAVALVRRMLSDYGANINQRCLPDDETEKALVKALGSISSDNMLEKEGHDVLKWFRKRSIKV
jgi:pentatricopeptide repeat protein